jgi:N-acyl-D-amino-acid deacylase
MKKSTCAPSCIFRLLLCLLLFASCSQPEQYDVVIRNALLYDGSGKPPIQGDSIAAMGNLGTAKC